MSHPTATPSSLWIATAPAPSYPRLGAEQRLKVDVIIVGAGITGLTTAVLMQQRGARVAVLDAGPVCAGVTAHTTGKVSSLHGLVYGPLRESFGTETARIYGAANEAAIAQIEQLITSLRIDCDWERRPNYTYTLDESMLSAIEREVDAAQEAGLSASFTRETELPFEVLGAVRFEDQAQFHARKYGLGLARAVHERGGVIYEHSRVVDVDTGAGRCTVEGGGVVQADHIVLATQLPILDRGAFFAKTYPSRSYLIAFEAARPPLQGMYISQGESSWTLRSAEAGRYLLVGGQAHKTGHDSNTESRYEAIERWARGHFDVGGAAYRWSSQDYMPVDGLPYIGKLPFGSGRVWIATGFQKWGLTTGTVAALIIRDDIEAQPNPWARTFAANRLDIAGAKSAVSANLGVARHFFADRARHLRGKAPAALRRDEGAVVRAQGKSIGAYRDPQGRLHAVSLVCTHLGCHVAWNAAERSWDCPCHGSRFGVDGEVLHGPAVRPLRREALPEEQEEEQPAKLTAAPKV